MIRLFLLFISMMMIYTSVSAAVSVRGYYRSNGTYVSPHMRSSPDGNFNNNWSTVGNVNPYTGKSGTKKSPSYSSNYNYTQSQDYSSQPQNYNTVPSSEASKSSYENAKTASTISLIPRSTVETNSIQVNGVNWVLLGKNASDATYIGKKKKEYYGDGLPVVSLMYTGVMKSNGRLTWLGKRFLKVKVNCSSNKISLIADAVVNSSGNVVRDTVLRENDEFSWFLISDLFDQRKFYLISEACS